MWGIIGGSGFEKFSTFQNIEKLSRATPFGETSEGFARIRVDGVAALFIPRHGEHHDKLPSEVNYRANIWALKNQGVTRLLSISAVGSLKNEFAPGDLVIPNQYLDRTKSIRAHTFCGAGMVGHVSLAKPVLPEVLLLARELAAKSNFRVHIGATYVCVEGPYFSTQAESLSFIQQGATIIGMSNFPEYALAREAGLVYFPACFVTDYDCWDDSIPHVNLEGVIEIMRNNNTKAFQFASDLLKVGDRLPNGCPELGLKTGVLTPSEKIPPRVREWLTVLQR